MLKLESESGTEIADSGFLIIYEKPADSGFGLPSLNSTHGKDKLPVIQYYVKVSWIYSINGTM